MIGFDIDAVVTFVDGSEPLWGERFSQTVEKLKQSGGLPRGRWSFTPNRYRNNGELELCLCAIRRNLPWIRKIWLVVSNIEQVPEYAHRYGVDVVLHGQIMPSQYLPTFNSSALELFLHKIPGLARHWLFFNDDSFIMNPVTPEMFFDPSGKPINRYTLYECRPGKMKSAWFQSFRNAYLRTLEALGLPDRYNGGYIVSPWHHVKSMDTAICDQVWGKMGQVLEDSITPFRSEKSINGYVFQLYERFAGLGVVKTTNRERVHSGFHPSATFCVIHDNNQPLQTDLAKIREKLMPENGKEGT